MISKRPPGKRLALLVAGMHRSGTSALTRVINLHGVELGSRLPEPAFDNESGFWENQALVEIHERLLDELGSSWDDPRWLPDDWLERARDRGYVDALCEAISSEFGDAKLFVAKDPRMCRLLPLWLAALERMNIEPAIIFVLRHPAEVVESLKARNGLGAGVASLLWARHVHEALQVTTGKRRCIVTYESLLENWRVCFTQAANSLNLAWPVSSESCAAEVDAYLSPSLRHRSADESRVLPQAWRKYMESIYEASRALEAGTSSWSAFSKVVNAMIRVLAVTDPLLASMQPKSQNDRLHAQLKDLREARDAYREESNRLYAECERHVQEASRLNLLVSQAQSMLQDAQGELKTTLGDLEDTREQLASIRGELAGTRSELAGARTELVDTRGELTKARARIRVLENARIELATIKSSRSWRWTRPFRFIVRTLLHGGLTRADRLHLARAFHRHRPTELGVTAEPPWGSPTAEPTATAGDTLTPVAEVCGDMLHPVVQQDGRRDYFVFSVIDWHFRIQRPQHLARELAAAGHRVFYISNGFVDGERPGFRAEQLDVDGRLFQIHLNLKGAPAIYHDLPTRDAQDMLRASMAEVLAWSDTRGCVSMVQHPFWMECAQMLPDHWLIYDCMDHHGGFSDNTPEVLARERDLMQSSDLLIVTSEWLHEEVGKFNPHRIIIRNACQFEHFAGYDGEPFKDKRGRRVIGYYGAIAEWFDLVLVEKLARHFPDCLVLLIGADTAGASEHLANLPNVEFTGEVAYEELPAYLAGFDVCLLPFQVIPLTLATNPVKVYEYLCAGKEVVSVDLPEIAQFGDLVRRAAHHDGFIEAVSAALREEPLPARIEARKKFAAHQTWAHRGRDLIAGVNGIEVPRVSVVVVTYNNLDLTKICLRSLESYSDYPNLEVIVVDNASKDGSPGFLEGWAASGKDRHVILNDDNRGFAAANNQGLAVATGDYLVLLNNDTHVTPGWISSLLAHLKKNRRVGMIGPVTNNIGNEARIEIAYDSMEQMLAKAADYTRRHAGMLTPLRTTAFFCVMMRREVYAAVGPLDEMFGIGFFEDDDYCRRVEKSGWTMACAEDVFVHHNLSASFDKLKLEKRQALFEKNKALYEQKWGPWVAHVYRQNDH